MEWQARADRHARSAVPAARATPELATFIGDAVLLPGVVHGDRVQCEMGRLTLGRAAHAGLVDVMIRPEQIRILQRHRHRSGT